MPKNDPVREELLDVLELLVDEPDELEVDAVAMRRAVIYEASAARDDVGKLIGRRGATARSLRILLDCRGDLEGAQYGFEIIDE